MDAELETSLAGEIKVDPRLDFFAGTLGGMAGIICGQPIDTVKVRMQTSARYTGTWHALKTIVREEKVRGLFKGLTSPLAGQASLNGMVFALYGYIIQLQVTDKTDVPSLTQVAIAGAGSGVFATIVATPSELIKIRQQCMYTPLVIPNARQVGMDIFRRNGIKGLYRGVTITTLRECIGYASYFATYEGLCRFLKPGSAPRREGVDHTSLINEAEEMESSLSWSRLVFAGGMAGVVSWFCIFPMDTIKSRMQTTEQHIQPLSQPGLPNPYRTTLSSVAASYRELGVRGLFAGVTPTLLRAFPVNMVTFFVFEAVISGFGGRTK